MSFHGPCRCDGGWYTSWKPTEGIRANAPPRHSDYRDSLPLPMKEVYELYKPVVKEGSWTFGLLEMWFPKAKAVKHSVHVPCWDSFRINPRLWRGICFGRTPYQCFWTGLRQVRWSRGVYAANLGREYIMPVRDISKHNKGFKSDIKALCLMYGAMGTVFGMGVGQVFTLGGNFCFNFAACYSCHSREKIRRKYKLPPMFGLPPGIDDCLVHFVCSYCASHQELRELAVRGVDGPGMHIMDVLPDAWNHLEGHEELVVARQAVVAAMLEHPPKLFKPRIRAPVEEGEASRGVSALQRADTLRAAKAAGLSEQHLVGDKVDPDLDSMASMDSSINQPLGWAQYRPPGQQEMCREVRPKLERSWSVAY